MINYRLLVLSAVTVALLTLFGLLRLDIDTDVVRSLPTGERILADGQKIFRNHPIQDQVAVDIGLNTLAPDTLVEIGSLLEKKMEDSGLFAEVGTGATSGLIPELAADVAARLPLLFSKRELQEKVAPLLEKQRIDERLGELYRRLGTLEGIGQAGFIGIDPLGLKDLILAKLAPLAPSQNTTFYRGHLLSTDKRHLLVVARPHGSGTDTAAAREIAAFFHDSFGQITEQYQADGQQLEFTPVGAYRAALDNERIIRHDVQLALLLATAGIVLLLLFSFPRPLIGLFSLVPALAGMGAAIFVYSLFSPSISIMVLGFGGAVISITVDHGIAYLLFLDRSRETRGRDASIEVRAIGIMAVITSIGAFLLLSLSNFPVFTQLGRFTALGIFFSFLFVHSIFPKIFPTMPAGSKRSLPLRKLVDGLYRAGKPGALAALLLVLALVWFAKPEFHTSLSSMNTMSDATVAADTLFADIWGGGDQRIYLMSEAPSIPALQTENDNILTKMEKDVAGDVLDGGFVPSMIFPGSRKAARNLAAWHEFWNGDRRAALREDLGTAGDSYGFTSQAFAGFLTKLDPAYSPQPPSIPARYYGLLGISHQEGETGYRQFLTVMPGSNYRVDDFFDRYGETAIFDSSAFTGRLAQILMSTFITMLGIIAVSAALLLFFFYLDLPLTLLTLLPPIFAYICTLGTLKLLGRSLDIPALMLSIVVFGMGIDYAIFCVRAHQRYRRPDHPSYALVRVAVFLAGASTLIGFGVLCLAEHSLLRSIGITSLLGIGYSLLGTFLLLPPLLNVYFAGEKTGGSGDGGQVPARYRKLEPYPRMFARLKLRFDPLFTDLARLLGRRQKVDTILDIGCGYGVPACWCLEQFPQARVYGFDPDPERVRVADLATADRGVMTVGWAPELPALAKEVDVALVLDMLHYLDDGITSTLLARVVRVLRPGGLLITRFVTLPAGSPSWSWRLEDFRVKSAAMIPHYRTPEALATLLGEAGFSVEVCEVSPDNPELYWIVARADKGGDCGGQQA